MEQRLNKDNGPNRRNINNLHDLLTDLEYHLLNRFNSELFLILISLQITLLWTTI